MATYTLKTTSRAPNMNSALMIAVNDPARDRDYKRIDAALRAFLTAVYDAIGIFGMFDTAYGWKVWTAANEAVKAARAKQAGDCISSVITYGTTDVMVTLTLK
jgi:hypothetical protein